MERGGEYDVCYVSRELREVACWHSPTVFNIVIRVECGWWMIMVDVMLSQLVLHSVEVT